MSQVLSFISYAQRLGLNEDQFSTYVKQMLCKLRVSLVCVVQAFDPNTQTVSVLPAVMEKFYVNVNGVPTPQDYPWTKPITRIPIIMPRGGGPNGFVLTMPVQQGDECLVIFNDMATDAWNQSGGINNVQMTKRRHSLSDGFAIPGPWSQPNLIPNYNTSAAELRTLSGNVKITITGSEIQFTSPVVFSNTVTFNGSVEGLAFLNHEHSLDIPSTPFTGNSGTVDVD